MDMMTAMQERHSVRSFTDKAVEPEKMTQIQAEIDRWNAASGLHIQMVTEEPKAFDGFMAHYGKFSGVRNYLAMIGPKGDKLEESLGYAGEHLVLLMQSLGLNSCWVALTFSKGKVPAKVGKGEKLVCVIPFGYGASQGVAHKSKAIEALSEVSGPMPDWFRRGMEAACLAPTAVNQQKFKLILKRDKVEAQCLGGFYSKVDLGIVKCHFELGAGKDKSIWA